MSWLRLAGKLMCALGAVIVVFGVFIVLRNMVWGGGLAALIGAAFGVFLALFVGLPVSVAGLVMYLVGRLRR